MTFSHNVLGKAPRYGRMQGVGKFIMLFIYFQTFQRPDDKERERKHCLWRESINCQMEKMRNELRKTPRHSNIASSSYLCAPVEKNNAIEDYGINCMEVGATAETPKVRLSTIFTYF